jgi:hypothetical protein
VTVAEFVFDPGVVGATTTVTVTSLAPTDPRLHVTDAFEPAHGPWLAAADWNTTPLGNVSTS